MVNAENYEDATEHEIFVNDSNNGWATSTDDKVIRYMNVKDNDLFEESNTLYNDDKTNDVGLPLHPDATYVVAQREYGKFVKTVYSDIDSALAALAGYNSETGRVNFNGTVSAVLDNSGRAVWVVFDNNKSIAADQNEGGSNSDVRVTDFDGVNRTITVEKRNGKNTDIIVAIKDVLNDNGWTWTVVSVNGNDWTVKAIDRNSNNNAELSFTVIVK